MKLAAQRVVEGPSLETVKVKLDVAMSDLTELQVSLFIARVWE